MRKLENIGNSSRAQSLREFDSRFVDERLSSISLLESAQPANLTHDTRIANPANVFIKNIESRFYKNIEICSLDSKKLVNLESNLHFATNNKGQVEQSSTFNRDVRSTNLVSPAHFAVLKSEKANAVVHSPLFSKEVEKRGTPPFRKKSGCFFLQRGSGVGDMHFFAQCVNEINKNVILKNSDSQKLDSIESKNVEFIKNNENIESKKIDSVKIQNLDSKNVEKPTPLAPLRKGGGNNQNQDSKKVIESKKIDSIKNNIDVSLPLNMTKNIESRFYETTKFHNLDSKKITESIIF